MSESFQNMNVSTLLKQQQRRIDALEKQIAQLKQRREPRQAAPRHVRLVKADSDSTYPLASNLANTFGAIANERSFTNTEGFQSTTAKDRSASVQYTGQGVPDLWSAFSPYIRQGEYCLQLEQANGDPILIPLRKRAYVGIAAEDIGPRAEVGSIGGVVDSGSVILYEVEDVSSSMTLRPWAYGSVVVGGAYNLTGLPIITGQFVRIELEEVTGEFHITELLSATANYRVGCAISSTSAHQNKGAGTTNLTLDAPSSGWMANTNMPIYADGTGLVFKASHSNIMAGAYVTWCVTFNLNTIDQHASQWVYEQLAAGCSSVNTTYTCGGQTELMYPPATITSQIAAQGPLTDSNGDSITIPAHTATHSPTLLNGPEGPWSLFGHGFVYVSGSDQNLRLSWSLNTPQSTTYDITNAFLTAEPFGAGDGVAHV